MRVEVDYGQVVLVRVDIDHLLPVRIELAADVEDLGVLIDREHTVQDLALAPPRLGGEAGEDPLIESSQTKHSCEPGCVLAKSSAGSLPIPSSAAS